MRPRALAASALALLASVPAFGAGRLDLDLYGPESVRFTGGAAAPAPAAAPASLWVPGDPRDLRAEPKPVAVAAETGYAALGAVGAAQALRGAGSSKASKEEAGGFIAVALISFWGLLQTLWN
jgi:hypothetical protein